MKDDEMLPLLLRLVTYGLVELGKVTAARDPGSVDQVLAALHAEQRRAIANATTLVQTALGVGIDPGDLQARVQEFVLALMKVEMKFAHGLVHCMESIAEDDAKVPAAH